MSHQENDLELKEVVFHDLEEVKNHQPSPQSKSFTFAKEDKYPKHSKQPEHSKNPEHPIRHTHRTYQNSDSRLYEAPHHPVTPKNKWNLGCLYLDKECISYFVQMIVLFAIMAVSLYKVATTSESKELWISLLSSCMGYILPAPSLKKDKN